MHITAVTMHTPSSERSRLICLQPKNSESHAVRVAAPVQVIIPEGTLWQETEQLVHEAGLLPPFLIKPLWSDGRPGSHGLAVVYDLPSLDTLLSGAPSSNFSPPVVVQQFVLHGGVLNKVRDVRL